MMIMMSSRPCFFSAAFEFRHGGEVRGRQRRDAEDMHVVLDRLPRRLVGGGEQRPDIDVEADIGEGGRDHLLAAVVAVLADLGDEDARAAALGILERIDQFLHFLDPVGHGGRLPLVDAGDGLDFGAVTPEHLFHRVRNFADGGLGARRIDRQRQQIAVAFAGAARQRGQRGIDVLLVALGRSRFSLSICRRRTVEFSTLSTSIAASLTGLYLLTPITACRPASIRACVLAEASSMRSFGTPASIALAMPPSASTSWIWPQAFAGEVAGQPLDII